MTENNEKPLGIVLAEDDPVSCRLLFASLAKWGYDVVSFREAEIGESASGRER